MYMHQFWKIEEDFVFCLQKSTGVVGMRIICLVGLLLTTQNEYCKVNVLSILPYQPVIYYASNIYDVLRPNTTKAARIDLSCPLQGN